MRVLDRYIFRIFLGYYLLAVASFAGLYLLVDSFEHLEDFLSSQDNLWPFLLRYYASNLPGILYRIGPALTVVAAIFTLTRLARHNELVPMKASGIGVTRICLPIFAGAALVAAALGSLPEWAIPTLMESLRQAGGLKESKFTRPPLFADPDGNVLYVSRYYPDLSQMGDRDQGRSGSPDVVITRRYPEGEQRSRILADYGVWAGDGQRGHWMLFHGEEVFFLKDGAPEVDADGVLRRAVFGEEGYRFDTALLPVDIESSGDDVSNLSFPDLLAQYRRLRLPHLQVKIHGRLAYPFSNVVLLLLGIPFALIQGNRSMVLGFLVSLVVCFAYFLVEFIVGDLGAHGQIPPAVAAWIPVVFFGALGWMLFDTVPT